LDRATTKRTNELVLLVVEGKEKRRRLNKSGVAYHVQPYYTFEHGSSQIRVTTLRLQSAFAQQKLNPVTILFDSCIFSH
jgi:hypothetical protein